MNDDEIINRALIALVRELEKELQITRNSLAAEEANSDRLMEALKETDQ